MRLLAVGEQTVDLIMVQRKQLGTYSNLQIDMCGIIDRSDKLSQRVSVFVKVETVRAADKSA